MKVQKSYDTLNHIRLMCSDKISLDTKLFMSLLSIKTIPKVLEIIILLIEYCQFYSQALLLNAYFLPTPESHFSNLSTNITHLTKFFSPGQYIEFNNYNMLAVGAFTFIISYLLLKYIFILWMIFSVVKRIKPFQVLMVIWKWFFRVHGRVLFYLITSFWVCIAQAASQDKFDLLGIGNIPVITISLIVITVDYLFSLAIYVRYAHLLPNKSFLATKDNRQELINLTQKFIIQVLAVSLSADSLISSLIFNFTNLLFSIISLYTFFRVLPSYQIKALVYEGTFLVGFASLNIVFIIRSFISLVTGRKLLMDTAILVILISIPLLVKATEAYLNRIILNLLSKKTNQLPELLIHKIHLIKHFRKKQKHFNDHSKNIGLSYLIHTSYNQCAETVFNIDLGSLGVETVDFNKKHSANKIFLTYLENLALRFPKNHLIKLYLAFYYGRKFKNYGLAIKILFGLQQSAPAKVGLNASVLIYEIQKKIKAEYENNQGLDLAAYVYNLAAMTEIKQKILEQAESQIKICQEFNENSPDLCKVFNYAQKVGNQRSRLERKMKEVFETLPEYNLEPQLLSARYQLVLNHSILDYLEEAKNFTKKCQKYAKHLSENHLGKENIYQKENGFIMVATQGGNTGTITYCSRSAENIFGSDLTGNFAYSIVPLFLQNFFFDFFKNPLDGKYEAFFGNIIRTYGYHQSGHLIEMDFYINIHPFISQGLYYDILIHAIHSSNDILMINENGTIEAYTKEIGKNLGLSSIKDSVLKQSITVDKISDELAKINLAYNIVNFKEKRKTIYKKLTGFTKALEEGIIPEEINACLDDIGIHEAKDICAAFNSEGKPLVLRPLKNMQSKSPLTYNCRIHTQYYGSHFVKIINLEKVDIERENIEKAKSFIWKASERLNSAIKKGLSQKLSAEHKMSEIFQPGKTMLDPNFLNPQVENFESLFDSYPIYTENQSCDVTEPPADHIPIADFFQKSKTHISGDDPISSITKHSARREDQNYQGLKVLSSKADNNTPSQVKKIKEAFGKKWEQDEKNAVEKLEIAQKSLESQKSKSSGQGRVSKALKEAMTINYYPRYYNFFILIFYGLFFGIFICMLTLKLTFYADIGSRKEEKDVIRSSELRNDMLTMLQRDLRNIVDLYTGRQQVEDLGLPGKSIPDYIESTENLLLYLGSLNNQLLLASKGLSEEFRQKLFDRNVRVFETDFNETEQKFIYLNNFQATERIVESGFKGLNLAKTDMPAAIQYFNFIFRNALNDFLVKCDEISNIFIQSLDTKKENTLESLDWILLATNVLICFVIVISGFVVAQQYNTEKKHMLAFIRLNHIKVREILDGLLSFKQVLEEDSSFDEVSNVDISKFSRIHQKTDVGSKKIKQVRLQNFNFRGIFSKYLQYWISLVVLMVAIVCFLVLDYVKARDTITGLHFELHQIQFSDRMSARLNLAVLVTQEMLLKGNTTLIRNEPAPTQVEVCLEDVKIMRKELTYMFETEEDTGYDSIVEAIVFRDACPYLGGISEKACQVMKQGTDHAGLLNAASELELGITSRRDEYQSSNKSVEVLKEIQIYTRNSAVYPNLVLNRGTTVISESIEKVYEKQILDAKTESNLIFGSTCVIMILVAILAWFRVLKKVRGADGKFKKVLQTLPPNLILSNFVLKSYLLATSQGTLDFVRNQI